MSYIVTPFGELRFPMLITPETKFTPAPEFTCGIFLTDAETHKVEAELRAAFAAAFPGRAGNVKLPFRTDKDGRRYLQARSTLAPKITDPDRKPVQVTVRHRDQGALLLLLRPYSDDKGQGVATYLSAVRVPARTTSEKDARAVGADRAQPAINNSAPIPF